MQQWVLSANIVRVIVVAGRVRYAMLSCANVPMGSVVAATEDGNRRKADLIGAARDQGAGAVAGMDYGTRLWTARQ